MNTIFSKREKHHHVTPLVLSVTLITVAFAVSAFMAYTGSRDEQIPTTSNTLTDEQKNQYISAMNNQLKTITPLTTAEKNKLIQEMQTRLSK